MRKAGAGAKPGEFGCSHGYRPAARWQMPSSCRGRKLSGARDTVYEAFGSTWWTLIAMSAANPASPATGTTVTLPTSASLVAPCSSSLWRYAFPAFAPVSSSRMLSPPQSTSASVGWALGWLAVNRSNEELACELEPRLDVEAA